MRRQQAREQLRKDIAIIVIGALIAVILSTTGCIDKFITYLGGDIISSFIAGLFFTSVFTLAPASVAMADLAQHGSATVIAFWGALGAMLGDLVLFFFIRDRFMDDLLRSFRPRIMKHILHTFHFGFLKWISPILGAFIIASPLPDELGLTLMGLSKTKVIVLMPISFVMNMLGISLITWFARIIA